MQINVTTLSGKTIIVRVTGADPVETVKTTFQNEAESQGAEDDVSQPFHLTFGGKTLTDGKTISDYGIQDGASIQQVPQASGSTDQNGQPILTRPKPSDTIDNVLEFLYRQGYDKAYKTFQEELAAVKDGEKPSQEATFRAPGPVSLDNHLKRNIPQASTVSASSLTDAITPEFIAQAEHIVERLSKQEGAKESDAAKGKEAVGGINVSLLDPAERVIGYKRFKLWVENSLDHWKPELETLLYPVFVHTFLDLVDSGFAAAGREFFTHHSVPHKMLHHSHLATLQSVSGKHHVLVNPLVNRYRTERYTVQLTNNTFGLVVQWLSGAGLDEEWDMGQGSLTARAKEAVRGIFNNRIQINVIEQSAPLEADKLRSQVGLLSSILPGGLSTDDFNASTTLKLGPLPTTEKLKDEVQRTLVREGLAEPSTEPDGDDAMKVDEPASEVKVEGDDVSPTAQETVPPLPANFKTMDVAREVEKVKDARKAIRLGPIDTLPAQGESSKMALPSVLAFTMFDNGEGITSVDFSQDSSLMAAGSAESSIRLWSIKGEKLKGKRLARGGDNIEEDEGLPMRKLIGHSGPVYSVAFDPVSGSASAPRSLLSASQDGTVRLWSMDTYTNLVAYRGHKDPVWDVEWGPMGVYFATASRDRTARLWSTDRVNPLRIYNGHLSDVDCLKFHPNSLYLATGSSDNSCRLWDVQRGACVRLFLGHSDAVTTLAISPDGKLLASAGLDCSIHLWDLGSSRPIKTMTGHTSAIQSLSFSAESSLLVSGGLDCTVRCWDVKSAGGPKPSDSMDKTSGIDVAGQLPMGPSGSDLDGLGESTDLLSTFHTKRTPVVKTYCTPRNLCMVAGSFVPPESKF